MIRSKGGHEVTAIVLDHTIVPVKDREKSVEFCTSIFGFDDLGEAGPFLAVKVNDTLNFDFRESDDFRSIHYAFAMELQEFEDEFTRIRESGIPYGDSPREQDNMKGPGMTAGPRRWAKRSTSNPPIGIFWRSRPTEALRHAFG